MPKLKRVRETVLYVADLDQAADFYERILGLACIHADRRMRAYDVGGAGVLLLFPQGGSIEPVKTPGGVIPPHEGSGPVHVAFSIDPDDLDPWRDHLQAAGVTLEGRTEWPRVGISIYFRDPDMHLLDCDTRALEKLLRRRVSPLRAKGPANG